MSAAGRGLRLGGPDDFYETPGWCVARLLESWEPRPGLLVEPGAGTGAIIGAFVQARGAVDRWLAIECRATAEDQIRRASPNTPIIEIGNFLDPARQIVPRVSAVVGNPPFKDAEAFVRQSRRCYPGADVVLLLRINFLASGVRIKLWQDVGMPNLLVLPDRPPFTLNRHGRLAADATEYAWFVFPPAVRQLGYVKVLRSTSKAIRMAHKASRNKKR